MDKRELVLFHVLIIGLIGAAHLVKIYNKKMKSNFLTKRFTI